MLNILFTLLLGLLSITAFDKLGKKYYLSFPIIAFFIILGKLLNVDYGWYGVSSVFLLYLFRNKKFWRILAFALLSLIYYYSRISNIHYIISYIFTILPTILLLFYNGKLGKKTKYGYYIFYPLHMLILYLINYF